MKKPDWLIYINNIIAYILFKAFASRFYRTNSNGKSLLFINTGNIGDIIISSIILENEDKFKGYKNIYLLVKSEYSELLKDYRGTINIIKWNYKRYKWNLLYRFQFLEHLHSLNLIETYNLTSARGITCDELALLSGANKKYCLNSEWFYLKKLFGRLMDRQYDEILCKDILNEYDKHKQLLNNITSEEVKIISGHDSKIHTLNTPIINSDLSFNDYIVISPVASVKEKSYNIESMITICQNLSQFNDIILLGNKSEKEWIEQIVRKNKRIKNYAGEFSLNEIPTVISNCMLYIGNDSGLTHIALKSDVPLIGIIGGGTFGRYFPFLESEKRIYLYHKLDCFGCEWNCNFPEQYCLSEIKPALVLNTAYKLLGIKLDYKYSHNPST